LLVNLATITFSSLVVSVCFGHGNIFNLHTLCGKFAMTYGYQLWRNLPRLLIATALLALVAACGGSNDTPPSGSPPAGSNLPLSVEIVGAGAVTSQPDGLNCNTGICTAAFAPDTAVTLTATPAAGQSFAGWAGACAGAAGTCVVTMDPARVAATPDVTARFVPSAGQTTYSFSLTIAGAGTVVSSPAGINCTANCAAVFPANALVTLTATPATGQSFAGWSGACTGSANSCAVTLDQARTVGARFETIAGSSFALNVAVSGNGSVASNPAGISCGSTCSANFAAGTAVTLTATPAAGQQFSSWGGACTGTQPTCALQLTQVRAAQAVFAAAPVASTFQTPQLLEASNDFNVTNNQLLAVNRAGDAIALWEQSDGTPSGSTLKVFSRRYQAATGWQAPVAVPGATIYFGNDLVGGNLFLDDTGVATWIRPDLQTRRNTAATGWGAAFSPPNPRFTQSLTSAVMDANGNIGVLRSGSDVENNALTAGGQWGTWVRVDNSGSSVAERAQVALSSNGTALAVWRESNPGDSNYSMKAARYTPAAGWGTPESIETLFTNVTASDPALTIDAQGNGIAMWQQGSNNTVYYNIYRAGTGWQGAVELTGQTNQLGSARIELAMTPDGRAVAAWSGGSRFAALNTMQYNPATGWTAPIELETYNINRKLQMDNNGQAVLVYSPDFTTTLVIDLVSRRLSLGGQWSAASLVETGVGSVNNPTFAVNPTGQGVVIWSQNDVAVRDSRLSLWSAVLR
jgi:Divergent InlB B-repeat domain